MTEADQLKFALRSIVKNDDEVYAIAGNVLKVDKEANTCDVDPLDDSAHLLGIDLKADDGGGMVLYPKEGSLVYVIMTSQSTGFVGMFSELDMVTMQAGGEDFGLIMLDIMKYIKSIQLLTSQGPTTGMVPVSIQNFVEIENRVKKFFKQ